MFGDGEARGGHCGHTLGNLESLRCCPNANSGPQGGHCAELVGIVWERQARRRRDIMNMPAPARARGPGAGT